MSLSHPNVVTTHKMSIVRLADSSDSAREGDSGIAEAGSSGGSAGLSGGRRKLMPALDGSGMVEVVDPHEVLQPG